jgi:hypothetical protein
MHYVTFWKNLQVVAGLEKLALSVDAQTSEQAQPLLAGACDELFETVKQAAADRGEHLTSALWGYREAHRTTGEKFAAAAEETAELLQKLATATYVDEVLDAKLEKLSGDEYDAARRVQLLGREYAVNLMRGLFA